MFKRLLLGTVIGGIVMFAMGFLIYGVLLASYINTSLGQNAGLMKNPPDFIFLFIGNLAWAWLITFVFERWAGIKTFASGLIGGALIVLPMTIGFDTISYATMNFTQSFVPLIIDIWAGTTIGAVSGGVIGFLLGKLNKGIYIST